MSRQTPTDRVTVASPCTGECELDAQARACAGCRRTLDEIVRWPTMSDDERRDVVARLARPGR